MRRRRRGGLDDLDDDIRDHIRRETEENVARGMTPDAAAAAARRAFGSVALTKEAARAVWTPIWIDRCAQDAAYAVRSFVRTPGFTIVALVTLALGVGVNTAIFSLVYGVLLRPLPFRESDRLVRVSEYHAGAASALRDAMISNLAFEAWRRAPRAVEALAAYNERAYDVTGAGDAERVRATSVSPGLFHSLELTPAAGRFFEEREALAGADTVVVLEYGYWQQRFGARGDAIGQTITLDGQPRVIVGVTPRGFSFPDRDRRLFTPLVVPPTQTDGAPQVRVFPAIARLAPGATAAQAEAEGTAVVRGLGPPPAAADLFFGKGGAAAIRARAIVDEVTAPVRPMLVLLAAGVALVLLVGCASVANLFLFRSAGRARELAIRSAIGAGRARLIQQLITESLVIAAAGGIVGTLVGWRLIALWPALAPRTVPRLDQVRLDWTVLAFAVLTTLLAGLLAGVAPALKSAPSSLAQALREGSAASAGASTRMRRALMMVETAIAVVLLVGSALLVRSFARVLARDPGYDASHVLTARVSLQGTTAAATATRWQQLASPILERLRALPGVDAAGAASMAPLGDSTFIVGFRLTGDRAEPVIARARGYVVTPGYAEALRLRLVQGRLLTERDVAAASEVMVVNEQFALTYLNDGKPVLGRRYAGLLAPARTAEIVGVIGNVLKNGLLDAPEPEIYVALGNHGLVTIGRDINLVIRSSGDPAAVAPALRSIVRDLDRAAPVHNTAVLATQLSATAGDTRFATMMLGGFGALSLALAAVGLYGVLSYDVSRRWRELGVRAALGATRADLVALVVSEGMGLTAVGLVAGLAVAAGAARLLRTLMFEIGPLDPPSFAVATAIVLAVGLIACLIPAWRASLLDPAAAIRAE